MPTIDRTGNGFLIAYQENDSAMNRHGLVSYRFKMLAAGAIAGLLACGSSPSPSAPIVPIAATISIEGATDGTQYTVGTSADGISVLITPEDTPIYSYSSYAFGHFLATGNRCRLTFTVDGGAFGIVVYKDPKYEHVRGSQAPSLPSSIVMSLESNTDS